MTRPDLQRRMRLLSLSTALTMIALPALAQGTDAQREACAPDAVKLCPDTIPDVERTTACMQRKEAQLSPRCRAVFSEAIGGAPGGERRRAARESAPQEDRDRAVPRPRRGAAETFDRRAAREAPGYDEDAYARPPRFREQDDDGEVYARDRASPDYVSPGVREYRYLTPGGEEARAPDPRAADPGDNERAREEVSRLCEEGQMDPETCAVTNRALGR